MEEMILSMAKEGQFTEEQWDEEGRALNPVSDAKLLELIAKHVRTSAARHAFEPFRCATHDFRPPSHTPNQPCTVATSDLSFRLLALWQAARLQAEKAALMPKRFGDDSDSDIDLDGL